MAVVGDKREIMRIYEFMSALRKWVWFTERRMGVHDRMLTHTRPTAKLFDFVF